MPLTIRYVDDYTDLSGEQRPDKYGWWIVNNVRGEEFEVDGPFATKEEAEKALQEIPDHDE